MYVYTQYVLTYVHIFMCVCTCTVIAVLKRNYDGLCNCLPKDSIITIKRLKQHNPLAMAGVESKLASLDSHNANAMIIVLLMRNLSTEIDVLALCDLLEDIIDDGSPKTFVHTLRSGIRTY